MAAAGAREWQVEAVAPIIAAALADHPEPAPA
jgi:hypothetical protein